jgi:hypothetical protein
MSAPVGETIFVNLDGKEVSYHIKPNLFSHATVSRLSSLLRSRVRQERQDELADIRIAELHGEALEAAMKAVLSKDYSAASGYEAAFNALQIADGEALAIALEMNCDQINSREDAMKVLNAYPNVIELLQKVMASGTEAIEAAEKNSKLPVAAGT